MSNEEIKEVTKNEEVKEAPQTEITKTELIKELAERGGTSEAEARRNLDLLSDTVIELLQKNDKVVLGNLGKLVKGIAAARKGRNPQTGDTIQIPEKIRLTYRPSKTIKDKLEEVK